MAAVNQLPKMKAEDEDIIKELCTCHGLNFSRLAQEGGSCVRLEMFFSGYSRLLGLNYFPNLQVLCVVGENVSAIEGLSAVPLLKELWIVESCVKEIEGLKGLNNLKKLYLYSNQIQVLDNLQHLQQLEVLWLNDNNISHIQGLSSLTNLKELNLAENKIEKIGNSLNSLTSLEKLEISGNKIYSFRDLTNLCRLSSLRDLGLKSPTYPPCPVGQLCNYTTHVLYHLPNLTRLDTFDVSSKALKDVAETTVTKKKLYYSMKLRVLWRQLADQKRQLNHIKNQFLKGPQDCLRSLFCSIKEIERELQEAHSSRDDEDTETQDDSGTESEIAVREAKAAEEVSMKGQLRTKLKALKDRTKKWEKKCSELEFYYSESAQVIQQLTQTTAQRLTTELELGGNVRFEEGKPGDVWFSSCHDLVLSRFCSADYKNQGIVGVKIHQIIRVHNRILRNRFDDELAAQIEDEDVSTVKNTNYKKLLEYFFGVNDPDLPCDPAQILQDGFLDAQTHKEMGYDEGVPLANSLSLADQLRIKHKSQQARGKEFVDLCPYRHGQLIIAKVFIGKSMPCKDVSSRVIREDYPDADSVFRPRSCTEDSDTGMKSGKTGTDQLISGLHTALASKTTPCECSDRQCQWFIFNNDLVLPEYIINFEYITRVKPKSPFSTQNKVTLDTKVMDSFSSLEVSPSDQDLASMAPEIPKKPRLLNLTPQCLLDLSNETSLVNIRVLNLHGNGLTKLKPLHSLPSLKKLIVSFNELTRLDDLSHLHIEELDASFNKITSLEGMKSLGKLTHLNLSWNLLVSTRDDISILRKHAPNVTHLDLSHNLWQKCDGLRLRAIGRLKSLTMLNNSPVTEGEAAAALRLAAGSRISQVSLLSYSRTDHHQPRSLSLFPYAQVLYQVSRNRPDRLSEQDNMWYLKVTTLNLDGQHISKLSNLDRLENLRWASFNDNDITKIEGLDACVNLEELCLDSNCLTKVEGLTRLTKLRHLSLSDNYITVLESSMLEHLSRLKHLSVQCNNISSLSGIQSATSLVELYVGNNNIQNVREIFFLKNLSRLMIVDLCGNPLVDNTDNYRLFVIYHLKNLRALDGMPIEANEGGQARDTFGGRLTQDLVAEKLNHSNFSDVRELDFPHCSIRSVDLSPAEQFLNLRSVNLEHNSMSSFSGLIYLVNIRVLCLNHNHIECIVPRPKVYGGGSRARNIGAVNQSFNTSLNSADSYTPLLENLEVLHLGYNGIKDMAALQLNRLPSLKALFLQGNEITKVEGLEALQDLRELVLDRNKIKIITEHSMMNQWNLQELHLEENRLREVVNLTCLENLQRLFLGMNRIQDIAELERLEPLSRLVELSVVGNAAARRNLHRPVLVFRMRNLVVIDGIPVTDEERAKAEVFYLDQQHQQILESLPMVGTMKPQMPVKVTNVQLVSGPYYERQWPSQLQLSEEIMPDLQRGGSRKKVSGRPDQLISFPASNQTKAGTISYQHPPTHQAGNHQSPSSKSQHQMSQIPYVPHQQSEYSSSDTRVNKNPRR